VVYYDFDLVEHAKIHQINLLYKTISSSDKKKYIILYITRTHD